MFDSKSIYFLFILAIWHVNIASAQPINADIKKPLIKDSSNQVKKLQMQFCPKSEDLFKRGVYWATKDGKWKNYTSSSADKIYNFIGAQWSGIHVGKIICLYHTNEAVSFPLAIEQVMSQDANEPSGLGWSSLMNNFKLCKSANIADCGFYYEPTKDISNIYNEIKYNPRANDFN